MIILWNNRAFKTNFFVIKKDSKIGRILKQLLRERERIKIQCILKTNFFVREMGKKYFKTNSLRGRENIQNTMRFKTNSFVKKK